VDISQMISLGQVALVTTIFAVVNTVVFTLLGMIAAILYNLAAKLVGGVTLTLSDES
jgi:integral membrane protein